MRPESKEERTHLLRKGFAAFRGLLPFARRHSFWFVRGALAAAGVVAVRLALPWPLRGVVDQWAADGGNSIGGISRFLPPQLDFVFVMGLSFLVLIFLLGYLDYRERLCFARFTAGMVRDLRTDAMEAASRVSQEERTLSTGDLVTRLIGDAARIKSGLQGFLVHVATGGLVFFGVTAVLMVMDPSLGLIFAAAGIGTALVTVWGAIRIFKKSLKKRKKAGKFADRIHGVLEGGPDDADDLETDRSNGRHGASTTKIQGTATWITHGVFGVAALAALWVGSASVDKGQMKPGDMVVFMMYTLMMRGPIVRLARQGCRSGKILGSAYRLAQVFPKVRESKVSDPGALSTVPFDVTTRRKI